MEGPAQRVRRSRWIPRIHSPLAQAEAQTIQAMKALYQQTKSKQDYLLHLSVGFRKCWLASILSVLNNDGK